MNGTYDLVIVGLGSAGSAAAELAAGLELRVAVVEAHRVGGHRLWGGDVPVATLAASANAAHLVRCARQFGVHTGPPDVDLAMVWRRIRAVQAAIARDAAVVERLRDQGVDVYTGTGRAGGSMQVVVDDGSGDATRVIEGRYVLWCTGSRPTVPAIEGLDEVPWFTSDTLFHLERPPASLVVLGAGAHAVSVAQSLQRLGVSTTLVAEAPRLLPHDEPSLTIQLAARLAAEGVRVEVDTWIDSVHATADGGVRVRFDGTPDAVAGGLVMMSGRTPVVETSGLPGTPDGLEVDARGRTPVRNVYAAGSVTGQRSHADAAVHDALRAVRDMFVPGRPNVDDVIPTCTHTDPALARVGLTSAEADLLHGEASDVWTMQLDHLDRAHIDGAADGAIVVVTADERIVGAHLLAPGASEAVHELAIAVRNGMRLADIATLVHVPTTLAGGVGRLAVESGIERVHRYRWLLRRP